MPKNKINTSNIQYTPSKQQPMYSNGLLFAALALTSMVGFAIFVLSQYA